MDQLPEIVALEGVPVVQVRGRLVHGHTPWDDDTTIVVVAEGTGYAGLMVCGRQYGTSDPVRFGGVTWDGVTLAVAELRNSSVTSGNLVLAPSPTDQRLTGPVTITYSYQGLV